MFIMIYQVSKKVDHKIITIHTFLLGDFREDTISQNFI